jgi:hypothetical protein
MPAPTRIILSAYPAQREGQFVQISLMLGGDNPFPRQILDVDGLKGCEAAFNGYVEQIKALGKGASVGVSLARGHRAPPGFKKRRWEAFVNLEAVS